MSTEPAAGHSMLPMVHNDETRFLSRQVPNPADDALAHEDVLENFVNLLNEPMDTKEANLFDSLLVQQIEIDVMHQ